MTKGNSVENGVINVSSNRHLIQVAVICLAGVSWFTTAQGMERYIFNNKVISYASSAAIQGILLAMSMELPGYIQGVFKNQWNGFLKYLVSGFIVVLTLVAMFCSSWFSYIYIAEVVHFDSWDIDSELLVQQTYRTELYDAKDYAHAYRVYLENSLGDRILELEKMADELEENEELEAIDVIWENERDEYEEMGNLTGSFMLPVIDAMRNAMQDNSSLNSGEQAARAIEDAKKNINNRKEIVEQRLADINVNIDSYNTRIADYTNQINRATEGTDISTLQATLNDTNQLLYTETKNQSNLLTEYDQLNKAFSNLQIYESYLGLNESTSSITIKNQLLEMQTKFFEENPDEEALLNTAESIFKSLRNAATYKEKDELSYSNLLVRMNQLILNLKDYSIIKETESKLDSFINNFNLKEERTEETGEEPEKETEETQESEAGEVEETVEELEAEDTKETQAVESEEVEMQETEETAEELEAEDTKETRVEESEEVEMQETEETAEELEAEDTKETRAGDTKEAETEDGGWQKKWQGRLEELKSVVSAMPIYTEVANSTNEINSLTDFQREVLQNYSRNESGNRLDDMIRFYIADHNALYQGIIYLRSPYNELAWFALVLAFLFDISGFILGFVTMGDSEEQKVAKDMSLMDRVSRNMLSKKKSSDAPWSIIPTLHKYRILTGDYEKKDGVYSYQVFEDGLLENWKVNDTSSYGYGIYEQDQTVETKGTKVLRTKKEILFHGQAGGPQDGVYLDCSLKFNEGSLLLVEEGEKSENKEKFLVNLYEYVPVHSYNRSRGECKTHPVQDLAKNNLVAKMVVLALNDKGSRIAAIYALEE